MGSTVAAVLPVDPAVAAALADARNRAARVRLVNGVLHPRTRPNPLAQGVARMKAEARASGLTDADIDAELAAFDAARRPSPAADRSSSTPGRQSARP